MAARTFKGQIRCIALSKRFPAMKKQRSLGKQRYHSGIGSFRTVEYRHPLMTLLAFFRFA
jgi:hypothetical protein